MSVSTSPADDACSCVRTTDLVDIMLSPKPKVDLHTKINQKKKEEVDEAVQPLFFVYMSTI